MDLLDRDENGDLRPIQAMGDDNRSSTRRSLIQQLLMILQDRNINPEFTMVDITSEVTQTPNSTPPNVRYPEYESPALRKETFINPDCGHVEWPHDESVTDIDLLVNCGLFYTGRHDLVRCFQCGVGLKDWAKGDNPVLKHIRHSPNCEFANKTRDNNLLWKYQKKTTEAKASTQWLLTPPENIHHPKYKTCSKRLSSYNFWPLDQPNPSQLSEAGFFYTGTADLVRCFSCSSGLRDWASNDDPWWEHATWFPNCQYVIKVKGEEYVHMVQELHKHQTYCKGIDTGFHRSYTDELKGVELAIEMGFPKAEVERAVQICKRDGISVEIAQFMDILLDNQEQVEPTKKRKTDVQMLTKKKHSERNETHDTASCIDADEIRQENEALKIDRLCKICMDDQVNIVFLPCGHLEVCYKCGETMAECPECKKAIKGKARIFLS